MAKRAATRGQFCREIFFSFLFVLIGVRCGGVSRGESAQPLATAAQKSVERFRRVLVCFCKLSGWLGTKEHVQIELFGCVQLDRNSHLIIRGGARVCKLFRPFRAVSYVTLLVAVKSTSYKSTDKLLINNTKSVRYIIIAMLTILGVKS